MLLFGWKLNEVTCGLLVMCAAGRMVLTSIETPCLTRYRTNRIRFACKTIRTIAVMVAMNKWDTSRYAIVVRSLRKDLQLRRWAMLLEQYRTHSALYAEKPPIYVKDTMM